MSKIRSFRLSPASEVLNCLSEAQRLNLYGNNIFLIVEFYWLNKKIQRKGLLVVLDMFNNPIPNRVNKIIKVLKKYAKKVKCLPEPLEFANFTFSTWNYGDRMKMRIAGKIRTLEVSKYFDIGRVQRIERCFIN